MRTVYVDTWQELQEALYAQAYRADLGRFRSPYAFRGLADASSALTTSLCRLGGDYRGMERHLIRNFRKYARRAGAEQDSVWFWLALGQHHGLPTRLLDWTFSPQVALHFATTGPRAQGCDGAVWCVDFARVHDTLPERFRRALADEGSQVFTVEMLEAVVPRLSSLGELSSDPYLLFLEPPSWDERIVNQFALNSVVSDPALAVDAWLADRPDLWRKVVFPAGLKGEIRDKLDQANITERVLFPGLDGLSAWLKRQYGALRYTEPPGGRSARS